MADDNQNSSKVFLWGVILSTVVGVGILALILIGLAPKQEAQGPTNETATQTTPSTAGGQVTAGNGTAGSGTAASGTAATSPQNNTAPAGNGTPGAGSSSGSTGTVAAGTTGGTTTQAAPQPQAQDQADAGGTAQDAASEAQQVQYTGFTGDTGQALYAQACQSCHMPGGKGAQGAGRYPALANNPRVTSTPYIVTMILNGNGGMPGFGHYLSDEQIAKIVNYVQGDLNGQHNNVTPADVKQLRPQNPDYVIFGESAG